MNRKVAAVVETPQKFAPTPNEDLDESEDENGEEEELEMTLSTTSEKLSENKNTFPGPFVQTLGNNLVIIAPIFTLTHEVMEELHAELGNSVNLIVTESYNSDHFLQDTSSEVAKTSGQPTQVNLILQYSLRGLAPPSKLVSHTEKIYYFVVNYTEDHLLSLKDHDLETLKNERYAGHANFESQEDFDAYLDEELEMLQEGSALKALKKLSNFNIVNSGDLMTDLLKSVNWAKYRLQPVLLVPPKI